MQSGKVYNKCENAHTLTNSFSDSPRMGLNQLPLKDNVGHSGLCCIALVVQSK